MTEICLVTIDGVTRQAKDANECDHYSAKWFVLADDYLNLQAKFERAEAEIERWKDQTLDASASADYYGQKLGLAEKEIERLKAEVELFKRARDKREKEHAEFVASIPLDVAERMIQALSEGVK